MEIPGWWPSIEYDQHFLFGKWNSRKGYCSIKFGTKAGYEQLGCSLEILDIVSDIGSTATEVNGDIPIPGAWNGNPCGQHLIKSAKITVLSARAQMLKLRIVR